MRISLSDLVRTARVLTARVLTARVLTARVRACRTFFDTWKAGIEAINKDVIKSFANFHLGQVAPPGLISSPLPHVKARPHRTSPPLP